MWISKAYAQAAENSDQVADLMNQPAAGASPIWDIGLVVLMVVLFYVLLILPQQRRFKAHNEMLSQLKKGDRVVTSGGLIGKVEKIVDEQEVIVDLGNSMKVTVVRSMIQAKSEPESKKAANDADTSKKKKSK